MAVINLVTAARVVVVESILQMTLPAAEAIVAGAPCKIVPSGTGAGRWSNANGTTAAEARAMGIATRSVAGGEALTCIMVGVMAGWDFTGDYDAPVYLSDTDGRLDTAAGTVSTILGRIIPGTSTTLGTAYDKMLRVAL